MKRKRGENLNIIARMLRREVGGIPPAGQLNESRRYFEAVVPNAIVRNVEPPPGCCISNFTPCGRFLVTFDAIGNEIVLYSYKGVDPDSCTRINFSDVFTLYCRCAVTSQWSEDQISPFSVSIKNEYIVFASSEPDSRPLDVEGTWIGVSELVTLHLLDMDARRVVDKIQIRADSLHLSHPGSVSVYDDVMTVVGPNFNEVYVIKIEQGGTFRLMSVLDTQNHLRPRNNEGENRQLRDESLGDANATHGTRSASLLPGTAPMATTPRAQGQQNDNATTNATTATTAPNTHHGNSSSSSSMLVGLRQKLLTNLYLMAIDGNKRIPAANHSGRELLPLERFYYFFEFYKGMHIHTALIIDPHRLLIGWFSPSSHNRQPFPLSRIFMVYNMNDAIVEQIYDGEDAEFAKWMRVSGALMTGGAPVNDWERFVQSGLWGHYMAERVSDLALKRHVFMYPGCQQHQSSPYVDPELYQFDSRLVTPNLIPQTSVPFAAKFIARTWPTKLRFRLETNDFENVLGNSASRSTEGESVNIEPLDGSDQDRNYVDAPSSSAPHTVYSNSEKNFLFHPSQPFIMAVLENNETGLAEQVMFFTHGLGR